MSDETQEFDSLMTCPLHLWVGLSYASWLIIPRVLMQEMPRAWREDMARLLNEFDEAFPGKSRLEFETHVQFRWNGKIIKGPEWLSQYRRPDYEAIDALRPIKEPQP